MADVTNYIVEMITSRLGGGCMPLQLSEALVNVGLDSFQVVELTFAIEEKFNISIPFNANTDLESKTVADLIREVERLIAAKARPG